MNVKDVFKKKMLFNTISELVLELVIIVNIAILAAVYDWFGFEYSHWVFQNTTMDELRMVRNISNSFAVGFIFCRILASLHYKWNKTNNNRYGK